MDPNVQVFHQDIYKKNNGELIKVGSVGILRGGLNSPTPGDFMDTQVIKYLEEWDIPSYRCYVDNRTPNSYLRLVLQGMNKFGFQTQFGGRYLAFEYELKQNDSPHLCKSKLVVLVCNRAAANPPAFLNLMIDRFYSDEPHTEFVDQIADNMWVKILVFGINELAYDE